MLSPVLPPFYPQIPLQSRNSVKARDVNSALMFGISIAVAIVCVSCSENKRSGAIQLVEPEAPGRDNAGKPQRGAAGDSAIEAVGFAMPPAATQRVVEVRFDGRTVSIDQIEQVAREFLKDRGVAVPADVKGGILLLIDATDLAVVRYGTSIGEPTWALRIGKDMKVTHFSSSTAIDGIEATVGPPTNPAVRKVYDEVIKSGKDALGRPVK